MSVSSGQRTIGLDQSWLALRLAGLRAVRDSVRRSDYLLIGTSARFRAEQRRRTVSAARVGFLFIAAATLFDALAVQERLTGQAVAIVVLNGIVVVVAIIGWWQLGHGLRRRPDPMAAAVTLTMFASTAITGLLVPSLTIESAGYLILFPVVVTLILPWGTRTHVRWLGLSGMIAIGFLVAAPASELTVDARADLIIVNLVALGAGLAGHGLLQLAAIRNHSQVRKIMQLRRRADASRQELARVHRQLEETARTDPLTTARNRLRLAEDLRAARGRMGRLGESLGIIAFDLDRFKLVNDQRGHLAGDQVLKAVVAAVRRSIRAEDEVYRFGGEEFLVLARVTHPDGLQAVAERIRTAVSDLAIEHTANSPHGIVTISVGAVLVHGADLATSDDEWFALADAALYEAKAGGRNRVELAA